MVEVVAACKGSVGKRSGAAESVRWDAVRGAETPALPTTAGHGLKT